MGYAQQLLHCCFVVAGSNVYRLISPLILLLFYLSATALAETRTPEYVGASQCATCHQDEYEAWRESHHFEAMRPATAESVRGEFNGELLNFHGADWRMRAADGQYSAVVRTGDLERVLPIKYTFGVSPLQQYLVEIEGGKLQALNVTWDARTEAQGGQRWFHLRDSLEPDSPFAWDRHLQNWNGRCAECHSTNVQKKFNAADVSYETSFSEVNVGCESCHGPGSEHVRSAQAGEEVRLFSAPQTLTWKYGEAPIASSSGEASAAHIDMCGGCHSRRHVIDGISPGADYHDQYELSLLEAGLYHADGQILDEVFVLGSFMQSKMHQQGVTCMNCHNAHTGKVFFDDNRLCAQCHSPAEYERVSHLMHEPGSTGAACVDCHMPATTYMQVDDRRDHRFGSPNPLMTASHGIPNACNDCHQDKTVDWAITQLKDRQIVDVYTQNHLQLRSGDPLGIPEAARYILDPAYPAIKRATLIAALPLTDDALRIAMGLIDDEAALVRMAAARKVGEAPPAVRQLTLPSLINDPSRVVRREAGRGLASVLTSFSAEDSLDYAPLIDVYRDSLGPSNDLPSTRTSLGMLALQSGDNQRAVAYLEDALRIEPHFIPARLNLADVKRELGDAAAAGELLKEAVRLAPDSGAANHSYGLYLVRAGKMVPAIRYLAAATEQDDRTPRFSYVYAIALDSVARTMEAVEVLKAASVLWPNQIDLLMLEVAYREKTGLLVGIRRPLTALARLAPDEPQVKQRLEFYGVK